MSKLQEHRIAVDDGINLHMYELGDANAEKTLVVVHGYGEHGGRYLDTMAPAVERGYRVLIPDMRGHGQSEGRRGHVMSFEDYNRDLEHVFSLVDTPAERTALLGHSNGGLIVLKRLTSRTSPVGAAAVTSPFLGLALEAPSWKVFAGKVLSRLAPRVNLPTEIEATDVSRDPEVGAGYGTDPHNHHIINARWFTEAMSTIDEVYLNAAAVSIPLLVIQGGADKIANPDATTRWAGAAPSKFVEFTLADGMYHEVLFDLGGEAYRDQLLDFFDAQLSD